MNAIDYSRFRSLTARELVAALQRDGFTLTRQRGSHHRYAHPDGRKVTVPFSSPGETFLRKTLQSIIEHQARWAVQDLHRLGLIS